MKNLQISSLPDTFCRTDDGIILSVLKTKLITRNDR